MVIVCVSKMKRQTMQVRFLHPEETQQDKESLTWSEMLTIQYDTIRKKSLTWTQKQSDHFSLAHIARKINMKKKKTKNKCQCPRSATTLIFVHLQVCCVHFFLKNTVLFGIQHPAGTGDVHNPHTPHLYSGTSVACRQIEKSFLFYSQLLTPPVQHSRKEGFYSNLQSGISETTVT